MTARLSEIEKQNARQLTGEASWQCSNEQLASLHVGLASLIVKLTQNDVTGGEGRKDKGLRQIPSTPYFPLNWDYHGTSNEAVINLFFIPLTKGA
ncbi:hypothetical protein Tco_1171406 [Tanacetum coccineum]